MARPAPSLSTLRSAGYPGTTQDSLPAAGQALPDGAGYPQGPIERFPLSLPPFPNFPGAHKLQLYYDAFEKAFLTFVRELDPTSLMGSPDLGVDRAASLSGQLAEL